MSITEPRNHRSPDAGQLQRTLWLFWGMFLFSSMAFVGVGWLLVLEKKVAVAPRVVPEGFLAAVGVVAIIVAEFALRALHKSSTNPDPKRRMFTCLGVFAAVESIAVLGLVFAVFSGSNQPLVLLGAIALVTFFRIALEIR